MEDVADRRPGLLSESAFQYQCRYLSIGEAGDETVDVVRALGEYEAVASGDGGCCYASSVLALYRARNAAARWASSMGTSPRSSPDATARVEESIAVMAASEAVQGPQGTPLPRLVRRSCHAQAAMSGLSWPREFGMWP